MEKNLFLPIFSIEKYAHMSEVSSMIGDITIIELGVVKGLVINELELATICSTYDVKYTKETSEYEGISKVFLYKETPVEYKVTVASYDGNGSQNVVQSIKEILVPVIRKNVCICVPHGSTKSCSENGEFHILIWSSPSGTKGVKTPQKIWGIPVDCKDDAFNATDTGIAIQDEGYAVAELIGSNLYIHHDLVHHGTENEQKIFRILLEKVVEELQLTQEERIAREVKRFQERKEKSRVEYMNNCAKRLEKTIKGTKESLLQGNKEIGKLQEELIHKIRETKGAEAKLEQLLKRKEGDMEQYGIEFDKLLQVPKVLWVTMNDQVMSVFTDTLYCTDPRSKKVHEIGKFKIQIPVGSGSVRWFNLTRQVNGYKEKQQAPHIWQDGSACLGNTSEIFPELIANYEFSVVAMLAIQFVESVNTDDGAGKHIDKWPLA